MELVPSEGSEGESVQCVSSSFGWFLALLGVPGLQLRHSSLGSHLHAVFPLGASLCPSTPIIRTPVTRRGLPLILYQSEVKVKVAQSCPTLCDPMDHTAHGILQARKLEWVAFPFSRGSSQPRDQTQVSSVAGGFFTS